MSDIYYFDDWIIYKHCVALLIKAIIYRNNNYYSPPRGRGVVDFEAFSGQRKMHFGTAH